jgi:hypothetical protein
MGKLKYATCRDEYRNRSRAYSVLLSMQPADASEMESFHSQKVKLDRKPINTQEAEALLLPSVERFGP